MSRGDVPRRLSRCRAAGDGPDETKPRRCSSGRAASLELDTPHRGVWPRILWNSWQRAEKWRRRLPGGLVPPRLPAEVLHHRPGLWYEANEDLAAIDIGKSVVAGALVLSTGTALHCTALRPGTDGTALHCGSARRAPAILRRRRHVAGQGVP